SYNLTLVFASYCVAVIAAYTAVYFGSKLFAMTGTERKFWLWAGALCLGSGIWSMHFVGMSAYSMPMDMEMSFSAPLTIASWIPAVLASALALYVITREQASISSIAASAVIMGAGISAMHYGGMYAMRMDPPVEYDQLLVIASIAIAVGASGAALVICRQIRRVSARYLWVTKISAALVMGAAICGMHYTGMAAASYPMGAEMAAHNHLRGEWMGVPTAIAASIFLLIALIVAYRDFKQVEREKRYQQEQEAKVVQAAFNDLVTGFANRSRFEQQLMANLVDRGDAPANFSLVYIELQRYRDLLANEGERAANSLIKAFAEALTLAIADAEAIARFNSSSFIVLMPSIDKERLATLLATIKKQVGGNPYAVEYGSWSMGYSHYPASATNSRLLVQLAQSIQYSVNYQSRSQPVAAMI
ncbi:MAG TPA: MHYT domain-containing protein, partial [Cellvibrionaceae bacterium]